ncbi:HD domain-containing protein [Bradyrhizobium sp. Rc2d]|nr:HD domain-containing protein [Bradyrhizobium sp. Rc2d]
MFVHVLADDAAKLSELCKLLDRRFQIAGERLDVDSKLSDLPDALVVRADLRVIENIAALKRRSARMAKVSKRIFLVEQPSHVCISQAYALGATLAVTGKINPPKLFAALTNRANSETASATGAAQQDNAVEVAAAAIGSMFAAASFGEPIDVLATIEAGRGIAERITERGLAEWLSTVRRHHEGTYQHCLLVTGVAIDFGLSRGLKRTDLERLYSAAMFHDIGKATIPLAILDKPGRLDAEERALVETHPVAGYEFESSDWNLGRDPGCSPASSRISRWQRISGCAFCREHHRHRANVDHCRHLRRANRASALQANHAPAGGIRHSLGDAGKTRKSSRDCIQGGRAHPVTGGCCAQ